MTDVTLTERAAIVAALDDPALLPPPRPGSGAALELRAAMARFSGPADHAARRRAVIAAIDAINVGTLADTAAAHTRPRLTGDPVDALAEIARVVPTEALAACLGAPETSVADVDAVVAVIGRGQPSTPAGDDAAQRLVARLGVAGTSLLYQNFDATAALIATRLAARATGHEPAPAVPRTKRIAAGGAELTLEIGAAALRFGSGPHHCPGEQLAEAITSAVLAAIESAGYCPDPDSIEVDPDGRPTALTLLPPDEAQPDW
jgi:cytochrome P450